MCEISTTTPKLNAEKTRGLAIITTASALLQFSSTAHCISTARGPAMYLDLFYRMAWVASYFVCRAMMSDLPRSRLQLKPLKGHFVVQVQPYQLRRRMVASFAKRPNNSIPFSCMTSAMRSVRCFHQAIFLVPLFVRHQRPSPRSSFADGDSHKTAARYDKGRVAV